MSSKQGGPTYTLSVTHLRPSRAFARRSSESFQELNTMVLEGTSSYFRQSRFWRPKIGRYCALVDIGAVWAFFLFHIDECTRGWHYSPPMFRR